MSSPEQPTAWDDLGATRLTARIGYVLHQDDASTDPATATVTIAHWCTDTNTWVLTTPAGVTVTSTEPLHLGGRIDLTCCALHGHIHDGTWIPTNPPRTNP